MGSIILLGQLAFGVIYRNHTPVSETVTPRQLSVFWSFAMNDSGALADEWQKEDPGYPTYSNDRNQQRLALATFYFATGGSLWTNNTGWLSYDIDECEWFSHSPLDQVCDDEGYYLHLHLDNNNLVGTLTAEMAILSNLTLLDLSSNSLSNTIPSSFQALTNLGYLNLAHNALNGSIPIGLMTQLTSLRQLGVNNNLLTGTIPSDVGNLQR